MQQGGSGGAPAPGTAISVSGMATTGLTVVQVAASGAGAVAQAVQAAFAWGPGQVTDQGVRVTDTGSGGQVHEGTRISKAACVKDEPDASVTGQVGAEPRRPASPSTAHTGMPAARAGDNAVSAADSGSGDGEGDVDGVRVSATGLPPRAPKRSRSGAEETRNGGRFSGRLPRKADELALVSECELIGPLVGGVGERGEGSRRSLASIVRGIANGAVRHVLEKREALVSSLQKELQQVQQELQQARNAGVSNGNTSLSQPAAHAVASAQHPAVGAPHGSGAGAAAQPEGDALTVWQALARDQHMRIQELKQALAEKQSQNQSLELQLREAHTLLSRMSGVQVQQGVQVQYGRSQTAEAIAGRSGTVPGSLPQLAHTSQDDPSSQLLSQVQHTGRVTGSSQQQLAHTHALYGNSQPPPDRPQARAAWEQVAGAAAGMPGSTLPGRQDTWSLAAAVLGGARPVQAGGIGGMAQSGSYSQQQQQLAQAVHTSRADLITQHLQPAALNAQRAGVSAGAQQQRQQQFQSPSISVLQALSVQPQQITNTSNGQAWDEWSDIFGDATANTLQAGGAGVGGHTNAVGPWGHQALQGHHGNQRWQS